MKYEPIISDRYYHIYNQGNNKEDIFIEEKNYSYFLHLLMKHIVKYSDIYCYCLLKNHFHLIIKTKENIEDKKIQQSISNFFNAIQNQLIRLIIEQEVCLEIDLKEKSLKMKIILNI